MNSYIIPMLHRSDKEMLTRYGIRCHDWGDGILIEETHLQPVLQLLNIATVKQSATEYEGIFQLSVQRIVTKATAPDAVSTARSRYVEICSQRLQQTLSDARAVLAQLKVQLTAAQDDFAILSRRNFVGTSKSAKDELQRNFAEQFETILAVDKVDTVRVSNGNIFVYTKPLYANCPDTGKRHELGRFLIQVNTDGTASGVRWHNLSRTISVSDDYKFLPAPRVNADGTAFADEVSETFLELIAMFEFATVIELAIQFVETVCEDDRRKFIEMWPER